MSRNNYIARGTEFWMHIIDHTINEDGLHLNKGGAEALQGFLGYIHDFICDPETDDIQTLLDSMESNLEARRKWERLKQQ